MPVEVREAMRRLAKSGKRLHAIREVHQLLGVSLGDAAFVVNELDQ